MMNEEWKRHGAVENPNNEQLRQDQGRTGRINRLSTLRTGRVARKTFDLRMSFYCLASPRRLISAGLLFSEDQRQSWPLLARFLYRLYPSLVPPRTDVSWYEKDPPNLDDRTRKYYEKKLDLSGKDLDNHFLKIRSDAWELVQYPCIGQWWFLSSTFERSPHYQDIVAAAREGASIADVACGFGQELRFLRENGATGDMYALDFMPQLWDLSLRLYNEKVSSTTFIKAQLGNVDHEAGELAPLAGKVDIFMINDFLYLCEGWCRTGLLIRRVARICKVNSRIVGRTFGTADPDPTEYNNHGDQTLDSNIFERMCKEETAIAGGKWTVDCQLLNPEEISLRSVTWSWVGCPEPVKVICFMLMRVE